MRRKQPWMKRGASVLADGKIGTITSIQTNKINDVVYVYYIYVRLEGNSHSSTYHPNDIELFTEHFKP